MASRTARELRDHFLKYFERRGHALRASAPIIPKGDPTLLFNSAGMVPFKPCFLGLNTGLSRAASCQKCLRTTDIDKVGATIRHLTFFEMLGNFSFGDYFKADAIHWAWEFLTKETGLDPKRLYPTVFKDDDEAEALWKKESAPNRAVRLGEDSNFWASGPTGPCGPCSEIYCDLGEALSCKRPGCGPGCDCDRFIEVWNLVFMQYNRQEDKSLKPLPKKNIDTGMGLERLAFVVQGKRSPFETDLFWPIMESAANRIGKLPGMTPETKRAFRIIGDHARAASVLASEGVIPSNVERGYVLRRLIRRAVRYGQLLGHKEPFLHLLVPSVLEVLGPPYPEIAKAREQIEQTLKAEEERFLATLERGESELQEMLAASPEALSGEQAFKLYETFGFPFELTKEICGQHGVRADDAGFAKAQEKAAGIARAGWKGSGETAKSLYDAVASLHSDLESKFDGYKRLSLEAAIEVLIDPGQGIVEELRPGDSGEIILGGLSPDQEDTTPFYPEGGGQVGDRGAFFDEQGNKMAEVRDTQRPHPRLIVHRVAALRPIERGMKIKAEVDPELRRRAMAHHTGTHLLNEALRRVLGPAVRQAGSLVAPDRLRFDFTHPKPMTEEQIARVEESVNSAIKADLPVEPQERPAREAESLKAVTLLGEDYGQKPRFVLIAPKGWEDPMDRFSLELCGGTHVGRTGEIGRLKIVKESSVAAGIRRIEALAGPAVEEYERSQECLAREALKLALQRYIQLASEIQNFTGEPYRGLPPKLADFAASPVEEVRRSLDTLRDIERILKSQLASLKEKAVARQAGKGGILLEIGPHKLCVQKLKEAEPAGLRGLADELKRESGAGVVFLGSSAGGKLSFVVAVTRDLVGKGIDACAIAREAAASIGGKAGGRPDFAQGGGPDGDWDGMVRRVGDALRALVK